MKSSRRGKKIKSSDFGIRKWSGCPNDEKEIERRVIESEREREKERERERKRETGNLKT